MAQGQIITIDREMQKELSERMKPALKRHIDQNFKTNPTKLNGSYQQEKKRQEFIGETLSRITPTSSLIYLATNLAQTGKIKKDTYFQTGMRYYSQLR